MHRVAKVCTVRETRTNTPLQALDLMNDVAFLEASRKLAERFVLEGGSRHKQRINYGFRLVLAHCRRNRPNRRYYRRRWPASNRIIAAAH